MMRHISRLFINHNTLAHLSSLNAAQSLRRVQRSVINHFENNSETLINVFGELMAQRIQQKNAIFIFRNASKRKKRKEKKITTSFFIRKLSEVNAVSSYKLHQTWIFTCVKIVIFKTFFFFLCI